MSDHKSHSTKYANFPKFLIQADFVTEANRQDIVTNSARNKCLLDHIAEAFVEAVSQCSTHANFRYQWMRFLPQEGEYPWGGYWRSLLDKIKLKLKFETVLWTRSHTVSRPIYAMRRLKSGMLDKLGDPLFPDSEAEQYLATEYARSDLDKLKQYGLGSMTTKEFLGKVRLDLDSDCSRIKSPDTAEAWHSRLAKFLISIFTGYSDTIEELALIPLIGGKWTSARKHSVYYPHVNGCQIPTDLGLRLVEPQAEDNDQRKSLFDRLDVKTYSSARIRTLIFNRYDSVKVTVKDVATSRDHLLFLYLTAQCNEEDDELEKYRVVHLLDQKCRYKKPHSDHIYFRNENPYGAHELFRASKTEFHLKAPGLDVAFIHDDYMKDPPKQPKNEDRTWDTWLEEMVNIRRLIPFCEENGDTTNLGKECLYVAKYRPEMFLGFLVQNWERDGERVKKSLRLAKDMLQLQILCENGRMHPLGETYFPAAEHDYARRFLEDDEFFPWIRIEESFNNDAKMSDLQNLAKELGFGHPKSELEFCLTVLRFIYLSNKEAKDLKRTSRVLDLYKRISTRYSESVAQKISREHIQ